MRTHFLNKLPLSGKRAGLEAFPDFDFYKLSRVISLLVEWAESGAEIVLIATYQDAATSRAADVTLRFRGVQHAVLPKISPILFLSELEIEEIRSDQLEGTNYRTKEFCEGGLEVMSSDVVIEAVTPLRMMAGSS